MLLWKGGGAICMAFRECLFEVAQNLMREMHDATVWLTAVCNQRGLVAGSGCTHAGVGCSRMTGVVHNLPSTTKGYRASPGMLRASPEIACITGEPRKANT